MSSVLFREYHNSRENVPSTNIRKPVPFLECKVGSSLDVIIPGTKRQIRICHLVAYKPLSALQRAFQDAQDAEDLSIVAVYGRLHAFGVQHIEPCRRESRRNEKDGITSCLPGSLTEIRPLAADLEKQPLLLQRPLLEPLMCQLLLHVVLLYQVLDDGARLPERELCIWVLDCRDPPIRIDADEWLCLHVLEAYRFELVRHTELFEDQDWLPRVWARCCLCDLVH